MLSYINMYMHTHIHVWEDTYVEIKPCYEPENGESCIDYFHSQCQYEPELFPGLIYRMKQPKIVLLIFVSGKIVLTGAKVILLVFFCSALSDFVLFLLI
jgi:hypothetical protein